jgi:Mg-chelatase subunit ChlD
MKTNYTEIAFILDRSGSMETCQDAAIEGFSQYLHEQQQVEGLAKLTLVLFDSEYLVPVQSLPVQEVTPLTRETYVPRSMTALLDAIARTVDEMGARFGALPEDKRPRQVIICILTDGLENASQKFGWEDVAARIKHQSEVYKWTFLFLGANQDAIATAAKMSIAAASAANYVGDQAGSRASYRSISRKAHGLRAVSLGNATFAEQVDAAAPLSHIVQEEDRKERGKNTKGKTN